MTWPKRSAPPAPAPSPSPLNRLIRFCLENKLVVMLFAAGLIFWGMLVAPFDWKLDALPPCSVCPQ